MDRPPLCGPGSLLAPRAFSPGSPVFPSPQKNNTAKFQFNSECTDINVDILKGIWRK